MNIKSPSKRIINGNNFNYNKYCSKKVKKIGK